MARIKGPALDTASMGCKELQDTYDAGMQQAYDSPVGSRAAKDGMAAAKRAKSAWEAICQSEHGFIYKTVTSQPQITRTGTGGILQRQ
jgi:hypothetical protein